MSCGVCASLIVNSSFSVGLHLLHDAEGLHPGQLLVARAQHVDDVSELAQGRRQPHVKAEGRNDGEGC